MPDDRGGDGQAVGRDQRHLAQALAAERLADGFLERRGEGRGRGEPPPGGRVVHRDDAAPRIHGDQGVPRLVGHPEGVADDLVPDAGGRVQAFLDGPGEGLHDHQGLPAPDVPGASQVEDADGLRKAGQADRRRGAAPALPERDVVLGGEYLQGPAFLEGGPRAIGAGGGFGPVRARPEVGLLQSLDDAGIPGDGEHPAVAVEVGEGVVRKIHAAREIAQHGMDDVEHLVALAAVQERLRGFGEDGLPRLRIEPVGLLGPQPGTRDHLVHADGTTPCDRNCSQARSTDRRRSRRPDFACRGPTGREGGAGHMPKLNLSRNGGNRSFCQLFRMSRVTHGTSHVTCHMADAPLICNLKC